MKHVISTLNSQLKQQTLKICKLSESEFLELGNYAYYHRYNFDNIQACVLYDVCKELEQILLEDYCSDALDMFGMSDEIVRIDSIIQYLDWKYVRFMLSLKIARIFKDER